MALAPSFSLLALPSMAEHLGVDQALLAGLEADQLGPELVEDRVDGLLHALAEVAVLVAVTALDGLEGPGRGAAGDRRTRERAVVEGDLDLDGGVAARVEDLAGAYGIDGGHAGLLGVGGGEGFGSEPRPRGRASLPTDPRPGPAASAEVVALATTSALGTRMLGARLPLLAVTYRPTDAAVACSATTRRTNSV